MTGNPPCILDGKEEVDEKDDPGDDGEAAHGHPGCIATFQKNKVSSMLFCNI